MRKSNLRKIVLTPRERDYMIDAARGMTVAQSAASRHVSINTVKVMIRKSRKRLGGQNITHAVALAIIAGDITPQDLEGSS